MDTFITGLDNVFGDGLESPGWLWSPQKLATQTAKMLKTGFLMLA